MKKEVLRRAKAICAAFSVLMSCVLLSGGSVLAEEVGVEAEITTYVVTEYELVLEEALKYSLQTEDCCEEDPLEVYERLLYERAAMSEEELAGMGYSAEEIAVLQAYLEGEISFETAAARTTATLVTTLTCSNHTSSSYTCRYGWSWNITPVGLADDIAVLTMNGFTSSAQSLDTVITSKSATVTYYYTSGTLYQSESKTTVTSGKTVKCTFETYKKDSSGDSWVWAKAGAITVTIVPGTSGTALAYVRAGGSYGHSAAEGTVSVTVGLSSGTITITYSHSKGSSYITEYGFIQRVFYVDGSVITE